LPIPPRWNKIHYRSDRDAERAVRLPSMRRREWTRSLMGQRP
jgi:hypothetical protein